MQKSANKSLKQFAHKRKFNKNNNKGGNANNKQKTEKVYTKSKLLYTDAEIATLKSKYASIDATQVQKFTDLPLSKKTLNALAAAKYITPTDIQRQSIGYALQGKDVLGAAVTGSGKTLAFLIPVLEHLYINKWSRTDGVGAIIISPTRELAYQIFETLKKVGKEHDFSAGLIIGGKNLKFERSRMDQCNILICTPGRLLQHMDENPLFNATTMEMLVLDEADRCLDMGFEQTLNSIIENFPPDRQTLLFSATQTNTVKDLARLNLREPVYVGYTKDPNSKVGAMLAVPELLQQSYVVVPLEEKITMLWSFIKSHPKQKIIVFLASCKQVKYTYEIFCKLRPGTSLLALYGTLHQDRRIAIYEDFVRKNHVVLFATDVASRGLDFPSVNWVVQLDCPEDVSQYIHRAGRSARNKTRGESLLVLLPSEEQHMVNALAEKQINVRRIQIDPKRLFSPRVKIEAYLAQFPELKASAQRAFLSYIKSVFLMRNKHVFNVLSLDFDAYAQSLGLAVTPRVRFLEKFMWRQKLAEKQAKERENGNENEKKKKKVNENENDVGSDDDEDENENDDDNDSDSDENYVGSDDDDDDSDSVAPQKKSIQDFKAPSSDSDSDGEDFIKIKRHNHDFSQSDDSANEDDANLVVPKREKLITKAALAKKALKKKLQVNTKVTFGDDGEELLDERKQMKVLADREKAAELAVATTDEAALGGIDINLSKKLLSEEDKYDKQRFRELVKKRHKLAREKLKKRAKNDETMDTQTDDEAADSEYSDVDEELDDDEDDEHSVDLSWLPDPDKVYKNKTNEKQVDDDEASEDEKSADETSEEADDDEEEEEHIDEPIRKKAKITDKLSLDDTEAIAANLIAMMK